MKSIGILTISATALLAACTESEPEQSVDEVTADAITVYSERSKDLIEPLIEQYTEETGNPVEVRYDDDLTSLINEEGSQTRADVFLSKSPGSIGILETNDHLAELSDEVLDRVPETVQDDEGLWVGISGRQRVLVYNEELVEEADLPESIFDLTSERWRNQVGIAPNNGSFRDFVTAMRSAEGDDVTQQWLNDLAANDVVTYSGNSPIVDAVGAGEVEVGLVNHYYNYRAVAEDSNHPGVNHNFPAEDPGSLLMVAGASILEASDKDAESEAFILWLLAEEAQTYFATETFEYPLAKDAPSGDLPTPDFADVSDIDYQALGSGLARTQEMISEAGLRE